MVSDKVKGLIETVMFWIGIATIVIWALGKSFGIIHSPDWVGMLPYFGIAVAISSASTKVGRTLERIDNMDKKVTLLDDRVSLLDSRVSMLENRVHKLCIAIIKLGKDVREIQRKAFCLNGSKCKN